METIILLHGALGEKSDLDSLSHYLKPRFNVFSFNFSGHGQTSFTNQFDIPQFSNELNNFIEINKLTRPHIFGYSMGGYVSIYLALNYGTLLGKIITLGTKFNWDETSTQNEITLLQRKVLEERAPQFVELLIKKHGKDWALLLEKTQSLMHDIAMKNYLQPESLSRIENQVLLGIGDRDKMVTYSETQTMMKAIPKSNMYILPMTKHPIETANSKVLGEIIKNYLD